MNAIYSEILRLFFDVSKVFANILSDSNIFCVNSINLTFTFRKFTNANVHQMRPAHLAAQNDFNQIHLEIR